MCCQAASMVIIVPEASAGTGRCELVKRSMRRKVDPEEVLSNHAYYYDRKQKIANLKIA